MISHDGQQDNYTTDTETEEDQWGFGGLLVETRGNVMHMPGTLILEMIHTVQKNLSANIENENVPILGIHRDHTVGPESISSAVHQTERD